MVNCLRLRRYTGREIARGGDVEDVVQAPGTPISSRRAFPIEDCVQPLRSNPRRHTHTDRSCVVRVRADFACAAEYALRSFEGGDPILEQHQSSEHIEQLVFQRIILELNPPIVKLHRNRLSQAGGYDAAPSSEQFRQQTAKEPEN